MTAILGVDVSAYNGAAINWAQAKDAGVQVAYVQMSQGTGVVNPDRQAQVAGARAAGILVGPYHLCYPSLNTPQAEVTFFRAAMAGMTFDLPAMLDDEEEIDKGWVQLWFQLWGDPTAFHYCDESYLAALGDLGQPQWTARPGASALVSPPDSATQFTSGPLAGFSGDVDQDWFAASILGPTPQQEDDVLTFILEAGNSDWLGGPDQNTDWNAVALEGDTTLEVIAYGLDGTPLKSSGLLQLTANQPNVKGPSQQYGSAAQLGAIGPCTLGFVAGEGGAVRITIHGL